jgi:PTS system nitrogen regulatory IIA component
MNLTVKNAAELLKVSEKTIYRWIDKGTLPAYKVHDQYRFNRVELLEWATSRRINVSPDIFNEPAGGLPLPGLEDALKAGGIHYRLAGTTREDVLREVVAHIRLPEAVDREFLYQVLMAREELGSTAIGDGIAIPHVRNPVVLHVTEPTVMLCFLETPVDFKALDHKPVHALFTMVSPTVRTHLHMLSRLSMALRVDILKTLILNPGPREEIIAAIRTIETGFESDSGDSIEI